VSRRVARLFVVPAAASRPRARVVAAPAVAVVGPCRVVPSVATTLALLLASRTRRGAVVARWPAGEPVLPLPPGPRGPATPAARALAVRLQGHGIAAAARGRAVDVELGGEHPGAALVQLQSVSGAPTVLALSAPRDQVADAALVAQDAIVVAGAGDDPLRDLALASLEQLGPPVIPCGIADVPLARALAAAALIPPPGWQRALSPVLEVLP
jgi:hypothetical protein